MEKEIIMNAVNKYLELFPDEQSRLETLLSNLTKHTSKELIDWNNFDGHICASGFIYSIKEQKFLMIYHKDMKKYLYPGGHIDPTDETPLLTAIREVKEETGLSNFKLLKITEDTLVPFDIDTHKIPYNERLDLPSHYHFDFRYLFTIDEITDIKVDSSESGDYNWISFDELSKNPFFGKVAKKIKELIESKNIA